MSVYKTLQEFSIDDELFDIFESISPTVVDVPWRVCISSPIQELLLKESCFHTYETKIKAELAKKINSSFTHCQVKCRVSDNGFSLRIIVDKSPVLHCLFLGLDQLPNNENEYSSINTRSRKKYKPFTLLLINGKKIYQKTMLPFIEKLLSCQTTNLLLSGRDYHWILSLTAHYVNSSSVFNNLLQIIHKHPLNGSKRNKLIMSVEFEKILSLWNDIFNKFQINVGTISSEMSEKLKSSIQEHFQTIFSIDLTKLSLSEIHVEDIMKVQVNLKSPVICVENSEIVPVILYFLYLMSYNQQNW